MAIHRIRLAGPWELRVRSVTTEGSDTQLPRPDSAHKALRHSGETRTDLRIKLPCPLAIPADAASLPAGQAVLCRSFHCPSGLGPETKVSIVLRTSVADAIVELNQKQLCCQLSRETEQIWVLTASIRAELRPYNEIALRVTAEPSEASNQWLYSAVMEIEESSPQTETSGL